MGLLKSNARGIQAVANGVVVRHRHSRKQRLLDETGRVISRPVWIARSSIGLGEHAELLEISGRIRRFDWIAISIDRRIVLSDVLVVRSWKETKDSLSCQWSQYSADGCLFESCHAVHPPRRRKMSCS